MSEFSTLVPPGVLVLCDGKSKLLIKLSRADEKSPPRRRDGPDEKGLYAIDKPDLSIQSAKSAKCLWLAADAHRIDAAIAFPIALDALFEPAIAANMTARRHDAYTALADIEAGRATVAVAAVAMVVIRLGAGGTDAKAREQKRCGGRDDEMLHLIFLPVS
jgi:hypothetical protein